MKKKRKWKKGQWTRKKGKSRLMVLLYLSSDSFYFVSCFIEEAYLPVRDQLPGKLPNPTPLIVPRSALTLPPGAAGGCSSWNRSGRPGGCKEQLFRRPEQQYFDAPKTEHKTKIQQLLQWRSGESVGLALWRVEFEFQPV